MNNLFLEGHSPLEKVWEGDRPRLNIIHMLQSVEKKNQIFTCYKYGNDELNYAKRF